VFVAGCGHLGLNPEEAAAGRAGAVTVRGAPMTLLGAEPALGAAAPDFRVVDAQYNPVRLSDFRGKPVLISVVPSLDTGVCALQTKRFDEELARLPADVVALTISMDLPFAQKRFCEAQGIGRVRTLSDVVDREFGRRYGLLIKERGLLARAILVVGRDGALRYREVVREVSSHPDYDQALEAIRATASLP
jgi:thiol peroxidase